MAFQRFLIAPYQTGLQTNLRPWLIPEDGFARLTNAYVFRGRVRKRFGSRFLQGDPSPAVGFEQLQSRLRINLGNTDAFGDFNNGGLPVPGTEWNIGQMFSVGTELFTVWQNGAMLSTGAGTGTFNIATGMVSIIGATALTAVYYYPALPVMGLRVLENPSINDETLVAFDTQFAYQYTATGFERLSTETTPGASLWIGDNSQFFWTTNYRGVNEFTNVLYVTNFNELELMRTLTGTAWDYFQPQINATPTYLNSARIILPFKGRLVALNTWEGTQNLATNNNYPQRARYSEIGDPLPTSNPNAWREDIAGHGNSIDAATSEAIITAEFVKDRLIVYFERSTWELVYTGNQAYPFTWQKINTELGAESTFSIIPFDKVALGVGNVGIHACNGSNVERIDEKIPLAVFEIHNDNNGTRRVYGIRDYYVEMVYWSFPGEDRDSDVPWNNRVLVFNYETGSWAFNDDSITCFGYFQQQNAGNSAIWANLTMTWAQNEGTWSGAPLQGKFRSVIAGNQEGYVFLIYPDESRNSPALQITQADNATDILTIIDHNLEVGDFILIENMQGSTNLNGTIVEVFAVPTKDTIIITDTPDAGYIGGGTVARVSNLDILTKQYNFFIQQGVNSYIPRVQFLLDRTEQGEFLVDYYVSTNDLAMVNQAQVSGMLLGSSVVASYAYKPFETSQTRVWHDLFMNAEGETIQLHLYMTDQQITNPDISLSDFTLHALNFYAEPTNDIG